MKYHILKTDPEMFQASFEGRKQFEIRKNDRDFKEGDMLELLETEFSGREMSKGKPLIYTGRFLLRSVDLVLPGHPSKYGLQKEWVVMSVSL